MTGVDLGEVTQLAGEDRKAARTLAAAAAQGLAAEQARLAADAAAERELRVAEGRQNLAAQRRAAQHTDKATISGQRRAERAARRTERQARAAGRRAWMAARVDYVRGNAPAVYSGAIYGAAVASAVYGQLTAAEQYGLPSVVGVAFAAFIEGLALAMALTALSARLDGERAILPRVLTWVCAGIAASINYFGHPGSQLVAVGLAVASVAGITLWEIRSGLRHRKALRKLGLIPDPPARFGWRRWVRFPIDTLSAWSRDVRVRIGDDAAQLVAAREAERRHREISRAARAAAKRCAKAGDASGAYEALLRLAEAHPDVPTTLAEVSSGRLVRPDAAPGPAGGPADGAPTRTDGPTGGPAGGWTTRPDRQTDGLTDGLTDGRADARPRERGVTEGTESDAAPLGATIGRRTVTARTAASAARVSGRSTRTSATVTPARPLPDVSDLLDAGRAVRDELAAAGRALTRDELVDGLRRAGATVSNARGSALLAALNSEPAPAIEQAS